MIKKYEFWHPRIFEFPFYVYLGWQCLINRLGVRSLAKANYALDHGEIGLGSKLASQHAFNQRYFLPTELITADKSAAEKKQQIYAFINQHDYPVILKSNVGCVGKAIVKLSRAEDVEKHTPRLLGDYIIQDFCPHPNECGVFYVRESGRPRITGINQKHFPTVVGNGFDDVQTLAKNHLRYSAHWDLFLQDVNINEVLASGEHKRLSFIGSHTLGCRFTDAMELLTPQLKEAIFAIFESQPGFNYGRIDVKYADQEQFKRGEFVVIEVNGVASLPTHMFDPKFSVWQAYKIFFEHARYLVRIAKEQRDQPMELLPVREVLKRVRDNQRLLNRVHQRLMGRPA